MHVNEGDIAKYIQEHDDLYTCTIDGKKQVLVAKDSHTLVVKDIEGYFMSFDSNKATFVTTMTGGAVQVEVDAVFPSELIKAIKDEALDKAIRHSLERLLPAAEEMIKHYTAFDKALPIARMKTYLRVYVLKDADFSQAGKGSVVICPTDADPTGQDRDIIKGYVYCSEHDSIKFETVQAWRYRRVSASSIFTCKYDTSWISLMSA